MVSETQAEICAARDAVVRAGPIVLMRQDVAIGIVVHRSMIRKHICVDFTCGGLSFRPVTLPALDMLYELVPLQQQMRLGKLFILHVIICLPHCDLLSACS
jgi:hypothetical protein